MNCEFPRKVLHESKFAATYALPRLSTTVTRHLFVRDLYHARLRCHLLQKGKLFFDLQENRTPNDVACVIYHTIAIIEEEVGDTALIDRAALTHRADHN